MTRLTIGGIRALTIPVKCIIIGLEFFLSLGLIVGMSLYNDAYVQNILPQLTPEYDANGSSVIYEIPRIGILLAGTIWKI